MKTKYFLLTICLLCSSVGFAQDKWFDKYANQDGVVSVYISQAMFKMMSGLDIDNVNLKSVADKLNSLKILTTEKPDVAQKLRSEIKLSSDWAELMRVKDDSSSVCFNAIQNGDLIRELLITVEEPDEFVVIKLDGNFSMEDIRKMSEGQ